MTERGEAEYIKHITARMESWTRDQEPTIRLTHSLQAVLSMTKKAPKHPSPFDIFVVQLAEKIRVQDRATPSGPLQEFNIDQLWVGMFPDHIFGADATKQRGTVLTQRSTRGVAIAVNLLAYIASLGGLKKEHLTHYRPGKRHVGAKKHYTIGREIKIEPALRRLAEKSAPALWRVRSRFLVRGHFREQACGPGLIDRKTIFIQPFWKGPQDGPKLLRRYVATNGDGTGETAPAAPDPKSEHNS